MRTANGREDAGGAVGSLSTARARRPAAGTAVSASKSESTGVVSLVAGYPSYPALKAVDAGCRKCRPPMDAQPDLAEPAEGGRGVASVALRRLVSRAPAVSREARAL